MLRAFFESAAPGFQPYNPENPIKGWPGSGTYWVFDAVAGDAVRIFVPDDAAGINLPGAYTYPEYVEAPRDAVEMGPYGALGPVAPNTVCLYADADAIRHALEPLFLGKTISVTSAPAGGINSVQYGQDPRRQWGIAVSDGPTFDFAEAFIAAQNAHGVGAPGHWILPPGSSVPAWVADPQVTTAPASAITVPCPIRALLPNEQFALVPPSNPLFGHPEWLVIRTDLLAGGITLAQIQALVAQYNAQPGVTPITITEPLPAAA